MFCTHCGAKLEGVTQFCQNCGTRVWQDGSENDPAGLPNRKKASANNTVWHRFKNTMTLKSWIILLLIIAVLASIGLVSLSRAREKENIATFKAQVRSLQAAAVLECDRASMDLPTIRMWWAPSVENIEESTLHDKVGKLEGVFELAIGNVGCGWDDGRKEEFLIKTEGIHIGNSKAAKACETFGTEITENGVTFPDGCE